MPGRRRRNSRIALAVVFSFLLAFLDTWILVIEISPWILSVERFVGRFAAPLAIVNAYWMR